MPGVTATWQRGQSCPSPARWTRMSQITQTIITGMPGIPIQHLPDVIFMELKSIKMTTFSPVQEMESAELINPLVRSKFIEGGAGAGPQVVAWLFHEVLPLPSPGNLSHLHPTRVRASVAGKSDHLIASWHDLC